MENCEIHFIAIYEKFMMKNIKYTTGGKLKFKPGWKNKSLQNTFAGFCFNLSSRVDKIRTCDP
jgi:hypothetical protein